MSNFWNGFEKSAGQPSAVKVTSLTRLRGRAHNEDDAAFKEHVRLNPALGAHHVIATDEMGNHVTQHRKDGTLHFHDHETGTLHPLENS